MRQRVRLFVDGMRAGDSFLSLPVMLLALLAALCLSRAVYGFVRWPAHYDQFIVGSVTYAGTGKARDFLAVFAFAFVTATGLLMASALRGFCLRRGISPARFDMALWLALVPAAFAAGPLLTGGELQPFWLVLGAGTGLLTLGFTSLAAWRLHALDEEERQIAAFHDIALCVVLPLLALLFPFALNIAGGRLGGNIVLSLPLEAGLFFAAAMLGILGVLWLLANSRRSERLRSLALLLQVPMIAFYLVLIPPLFVSPEGSAPQPQAGPLVYLYVGLLMLAALVDLVRRIDSEKRAISPLAVGGLLICLAVPLNFAPYLSSDDYHFGEYIYPWWSLINHGQIPYVDYSPAHGLVNYLASAASSLFFDGTAAAFSSSSTIVSASLTLVMFVALTPVMGITLAWIPAFFIPLMPLSWLVIAVTFAILTWLIAGRRPVLWLVVWFLTGIGTVLLVPAQGAAFVLATIPAGLVVFWRALRAEQKHTTIALGTLGGGLIVFAILTPIVPITLGALSYVLENGEINAIAYGISWNATNMPTGYELLRMGWIAVPLAALVFALQRPRLLIEPLSLLVIGIAILFPMLIFGYLMGRIDVVGPTRMGFATLWLFLILLPVLLRLTYARLVAPVLVLTIVVCSAMLPRPIVLAQLAAEAHAQRPIGELTPVDFPLVGRVVADPAHYARLLSLRDRMDALLAPDETFLDLTGHVADYAYLGRPSPLAVPAPFNMAHPNSQAEAVQRLEINAPPVALLLAENLNFDGRSSALRSHLLYRWTAQTYRPVELDGFVYGVLPSRYTQLLQNTETKLTAADHSDVNWNRGISLVGDLFFVESEQVASRLVPGDILNFASSGPRTVVQVDGHNITVDGALDPEGDGYPNPIGVSADLAQTIADDVELVLLDRAFRLADLGSLPVSWGRSVASLRSQMSDVLEPPVDTATLNDASLDGEGWFIATGPDPYLVIDLPPVAGSDAGLLVGELVCKGAGNARMQIFWDSEKTKGFNEAASVSFDAQNGWFILPLDSQPRWLLSEGISRIRIDLNNTGGCKRFRLQGLRLAQRNGF